jgi:hypothetical protein
MPHNEKLNKLLSDVAEPTEADKLRRELAETRLQLADANADAKAALERAVRAENIKQEVFGLVDRPMTMPDWIVEQREPSHPMHTPVLVTSDFQWGEVVDHENMDEINEFNVEIAQERYQLLIDRAIDLSFQHLPKNRYAGLILLRLGDTVSGDIHADLRESNELSAIPAVRSVVEAERWGVAKLADAFGRVHVVSVPGNHGRYQMKPPTKKIDDNYDTLASWWLESLFRGDERVSWQTPASTDAVFEIHGRKYLATHGDNIGSRGGQGFIGPAATIMRGMKKTMDEYARRGIALAKMFVGHFHTAYYLGYGWSNGSLPGYSEYARVNRLTPEAPVQWLLFFHPKYGATSQWQIQLAPEPTGSAVVKPFTQEE